MSRLLGYFARGCLVLVPVLLTVYALVTIVNKTDDWLGVTIPGLGLLLALTVTTLVGFLASQYFGRRLYHVFDRFMGHVPVVRILYGSIRDIISALIGEQKAFGTPVLVRLDPRSEVRVLGFLTRPSVQLAHLTDHSAVYVPQAYNIGGQLLILPQHLIEPLDSGPSDVLTFVLSGGATGLSRKP
jgi:uncharacterized membrane protein